jgi:hypothetical protein
MYISSASIRIHRYLKNNEHALFGLLLASINMLIFTSQDVKEVKKDVKEIRSIVTGM